MEHHFDIDVAKEYGVIEAVLINHFQFWLIKNKSNGTNFHDGHYWTYNSHQAFLEQFPYLTHKSLRTALQHLRDNGIIITSNYNNTSHDRTLWYAFNDEDYWLGQKHMPKTANANAEINQPIPYNNTDNNKSPLSNDNTPKGVVSENVVVETVSEEEQLFDKFRKAYKGSKRGLPTEFTNFKKKHKDWREVLPILLPAYEAQQAKRNAAREQGCFVPQEKNLQTYINQRCWEAEEYFQPDSRSQQRMPQAVPSFITPEGQARQRRVDEFVETLANS